jgi:outer membrane protein
MLRSGRFSLTSGVEQAGLRIRLTGGDMKLSRATLGLAVPLLALSAVAPPLLGEAHPAPKETRVPGPWNPPALKIPGNRITLAEAVRLTLDHDPNLRIQEQATRGQLGAWMFETGSFDPVLTGDMSWLFTQQALTLTQQAQEKKNRSDIQSDINDAAAQTQQTQAELSEVSKIAANPTGYISQSTDQVVAQIQIQVLQINQLIANEPDPAKKASLQAQRDAALQAELAGIQANLQGKQANEQTLRSRLANLGDVPKVIQQNTVNVDLGLTFPYRDGVTAGLYGNGSWTDSRYKGKEKQSEFGGLGVEGVYTAEVGFSLAISLLRGRGSDATGAFEKSASIDYAASESILKHTATQSVLNTTTAYWNLVAAQEYLDAAKKAAGLSDQRLEVTKALIQGDELPRAEMARSLASQATDLAQVASAERAVNEARVALARTIGLTVTGPENAPFAADPFPATPDEKTLAALAPDALIATAVANRWDRRAVLSLRDSGGVLATAARLALRPRLDFSGKISANTIAETSLANSANAWRGPGFDVGFQLEAPIGNNAARGRLLQAEADLAQRTITATDLERQIAANIVQLVASVRTASGQVGRLDEAVALYGQTITDETERYKSGQSSLLDTIVTQDLQTGALTTRTNARQQLANLIARLRYETGTLVEARGDVNVVKTVDLVTVPSPAGR